MQWPFSEGIDSSSPRVTEGLLTRLALGEVPSGVRSTPLPPTQPRPSADSPRDSAPQSYLLSALKD